MNTRIALLVLILVIFIGHILGTIYGWYWTVWWYDIPLHFLGGAWLGFFFFYLFYEKWGILEVGKKFIPTLLLGLGFVILVGVLWEFYEYFHDWYVDSSNLNSPDVRADTLSDFLNDLIGGTSAILVWWFYFKKLSTPSP